MPNLPSDSHKNEIPEKLILVNEYNKKIGEMEKFAAHETGQLHRAFSVFLVDYRGRLLLQKRQKSKYHSGGLWSNTCCGHPRPGEKTILIIIKVPSAPLNYETSSAAILTSAFSHSHMHSSPILRSVGIQQQVPVNQRHSTHKRTR